MSPGRRAPAASNLTQGRPRRDTPRQTDTLAHTHIRIVPHTTVDLTPKPDEGSQKSTPVFRSSSLQFSSSISPKATKPLPPVITFADMARRYHRKNQELEGSQAAPANISTTGIVTLQPNRRKADTMWRTILASNPSDSSNATYNVHDISPSSDTPQLPQNLSHASCDSTRAGSYDESPVVAHQSASGTFINRFDTPTTPFDGAENGNLLHDGHSHRCEQLFGKLPDPIRLHEQTGNFDGQVIFIGHPNRDVSAHQWSSISFQWINIGRYAHGRARVEGSLASDRLNGQDTPQSPLEFFHLAAKNREKLAHEGGPCEGMSDVGQQQVSTDKSQKTLISSGSIPVGRTSTSSTDGSKSSEIPSHGTNLITPGSVQTKIRKEYLEDPFIASSKPSTCELSLGFRSGSDSVDVKGSLDFDYKFPSKHISSQSTCSAYNNANFSHFRPEVAARIRPTTYNSGSLETIMQQAALHDVKFGEEVTKDITVLNRHIFAQNTAASLLSPDQVRNRRKLRDELIDLGDVLPQSKVPSQERTIVSSSAYVQPTARSLFHPPGLTVANPHRVVSNLNACAPPYANIRPATTGSEASVPEATTVNPIAPTLKFSDPDGLKKPQSYEIANGLSQQPPTRQTFKGPFLIDSKPTSSDPTASLSVHVGEEAELLKWFRDGERPARQEEYAQSLISTAAPSTMTRNYGVIGDNLSSQLDKSYRNTAAFVRLFENLSEYAEESRGGRARTYFTQAWKAAPLPLREVALNNTRFTRPLVRSLGERLTSSRMRNETSYGW